MKKEEKYGVMLQFSYEPTSTISLNLKHKVGDTWITKELGPKDYTIKGTVLTLKKSPVEHFKNKKA